MECVQIENKIKLLFERVLDPEYVINNYYVDSLINKLSNSSSPESTTLDKVPLILDIIVDALNRTEDAHVSVKVFLLRMLAIVSQKELNFAKLISRKGDQLAAGFSAINSPDLNPSLRVAYMEVALAIANHHSGISWLLESGAWKEILSLCNEKRTVFVVRQTYKFAALFLWKMNDLTDEASIKTVLSYILKPMSKTDFTQVRSMTSDEEEEIAKTMEPMLQILLAIVSEKHRIEQWSLVMSILLKEFNITPYLYIMCDRMRKEDLSGLIAKLIYWLVLSKMFLVKPFKPDVVYDENDILDMSVTFFNIVHSFIQRRNAILVLDYCNSCSLIWNSVWLDKKNSMMNKHGVRIDLQEQLLFISLVPCLSYVKMSSRNKCDMSDESLNEYIVKLLNSMCEHTARAAYALRDLVSELDRVTVTLQSVKRLTCLKNYLNDNQANLVFQALYYIVDEFDQANEHSAVSKGTYEEEQEKIVVMTYVLDIMLSLVKTYAIQWHKTLEVLCLYSLVTSILKQPNLSCKFIVIALNVVAVLVKKFLQPNLSLLMESPPGTAMHDIGKLIYMKMHDLNWEVRDSALELLLVCTEISYIKFPPFRKQILENNLINVATTIALNDYEYYVQVSALKCLGAASKVSGIWDQLTVQYPNIQELLISILRNNQEGIVRKEACNVLCELYQNMKLCPDFKQRLYEHMVSSALSDFHWEVQISALKFWKVVIQSLLNNQGMLDGTFPPVTFSRETRKIVTLNKTEVQRRLIRILDELASIGCLTVLVKLVHEESEVDIMDLALSIATELITILDAYDLPSVVRPKNGEPNTIDELRIKDENDSVIDTDIADPSEASKADSVIDGILNADDVNLLANIYERHMDLQGETSTQETPAPVKPKIKLLKSASRYLFINHFKSTDFKVILEEKRKWKDGIRSVSSLLDDVLGIYEMNNEVNSLDCY